MPAPAPASLFADRLITALIAQGVTDVVVSPGSRSQSLALAAAAAHREGRLRVTVRIDERSAGFVALGLAVETGRPVAVIVTSGTAVANLHPAVLEAHHSAVPMLLLTADRPRELRGIGANQVTDQVGFFGGAARLALDVPAPDADRIPDAQQLATVAYAAASGAVVFDVPAEWSPAEWSPAGSNRHAPGPVQLNLAFREPLSGPLGDPQRDDDATPPRSRLIAPAGPDVATVDDDAIEFMLAPLEGTVVIAGHGAGPDAEMLARRLGAPLIAEVSSGARFGPNLVVAYRRLLREPEFSDSITRAIVFGHPTLSREVPQLLTRDGIETIVVRSGGEDFDPGRRAVIVDRIRVADGEPDVAPAPGLLRRIVAASRALLEPAPPDPITPSTVPDPVASADDRRRQAEYTRDAVDALRRPVTREALVDAVWSATWPHDRLVLASSRLIRVMDARVPGKNIRVHANRGLAGIDGTIGTATGIAIASQNAAPGRPDDQPAPGTARVLLGDLAMLHDAGSMLAAAGERRPRLQLVVGDDGGGTIFDDLEVAATADPQDYEQVMRTPVTADLAALATAYGFEFVEAPTIGELQRALTTGWSRPVVIRVPL